MPRVTFFRGTTYQSEQAHMQLKKSLVSARELSGTGGPPMPLAQLLANPVLVSKEIVARVGVETASGTVNTFSHFVPMGTNPGIARNFGHGSFFVFTVDCVLIVSTGPVQIQNALNDPNIQNAMLNGAVPVFKGGNAEYLAYTGTPIHDLTEIYQGPDAVPRRYEQFYLSRVTNGALVDCCGDLAENCQCTYGPNARGFGIRRVPARRAWWRCCDGMACTIL